MNIFYLSKLRYFFRKITKQIYLISPLLFFLHGCGQNNAPPPAPPPEVSVVKVSPTSVTVLEEFAAQTEAVNSVEVRARVGGILEKQSFTDGTQVKKDDVLFVIDQQPYITAVEQAKATLGQIQASYINSKQNLARLRPLFAEQAVSQQDVDTAIAKENADKASVDAAQAQLKQAELNLSYTTIRASQNGVISKALIKPGGLVIASSTLLTTLYSLDPIYANFAISEQKLVELQKRLNDNDKTKELPFKLKLIDGSDYPHIGKLNFIDTAVDPKNGTVQVRVSVPNPEKLLRSGQFVRVVMPAKENPQAIRIPQKAVQELQGKQSVFVVNADNKASYRPIVAKARIDNDWLIESGLKDGELVVVEGTGKLKPDMQVKIKN